MYSQERTILLVEDNLNDVRLFERAYAKTGLTNPLQVVRDGEEALVFLSREGVYSNLQEHKLPDAIVLDLKLPRKSGHEVLQWVREQPQFKWLPVVVFTSSEQNSDIQRAYELGANSYLMKPVAFEDLLGMVQTLSVYWTKMNLLTNFSENN